jgi:capsular polysaccharide biosynthesis protein
MRSGLDIGGKIMDNQNEIEIDLMGLLLRLKSKIWVILLVTVIFALGGYVGSKLFSTPVYTATSQVYVYQANKGGMDYNELAMATQLRKDCALIIQAESVSRKVIDKLGLKTSPAALSVGIKVTTEDNTRILNLTYTGADPEQAALIINTVREVATKRTEEVLQSSVLRTLFEATLPQAEITTNVRKSTLVGGAVGAASIIVLLIIVFLLDDTIRTEDDVQVHLGLSTLAVIPLSNELLVSRGRRNGSQKQPFGRWHQRR